MICIEDFTEVVHKVFRINGIPALDQVMAWRWPGEKPFCKQIIVSLLTVIKMSLKFDAKEQIDIN